MRKLPESVVATAEQLTRQAEASEDPDARRPFIEERDRLLGAYGYAAWLRKDDRSAVLVCYPARWVQEGTVRFEEVDDLDRAVERPLWPTGDEEDYEQVAAHNRRVVERVHARAGGVHAANAEAFAVFMSNHYVRRVDEATSRHVTEFLDEYYPRNAWPTEEERATITESLRLVFEVVDQPPPKALAQA